MTSIAGTLGAGTGVDTDALIAKLVDAGFTPKSNALKTKEDLNTARVSALASAGSGIDSFAGSLSALIAGGTLSTQPTSSNTTLLTATARPGAKLGNLSAQLEVRQLAQAQSLASSYLTGGAATVGQGSLTLTTASGSYTVTIGPANDSLTGLAQAINAAGAGVTASVVQDANGARLAIKGATGAASAFSLTPAAGADPGLARFQYDATTHAMTQAQAAQDAIVRLDGVDVSRATNNISDLIDGVTLQLKAAAPGTSVSLGATRPTDAINQAVADFVSAYNSLKSQLDTATAPASGNTPAGPLHGDTGIRTLQRQLAGMTSAVLNSSGGPSTLAEIGVSTNRDGTLSLDQTKLAAMQASNPDGVEALFNPTQHSDNPLIKISSAIGAAKPGSYALANIVPATNGSNSSGMIAGFAGISTGTKLYASVASPASGLVIEPQGSVASAIVTVDAGLGGVLQAIRDALQGTNGALASSNALYTTQKTQLADQRTKLSSDQDNYKAKLTSQFSRMDAKVAAYKSTGSFLDQQIAAWDKSS